MDTITQKVLTLDLSNLTVAELDWLHGLKNKAQHIRIAEFKKANGITLGGRS